MSDLNDVRHVTQVELFDMSNEDALESPGWETRLGDGEISLEQHDLFAVRRIRVRIEEGY